MGGQGGVPKKGDKSDAKFLKSPTDNPQALCLRI